MKVIERDKKRINAEQLDDFIVINLGIEKEIQKHHQLTFLTLKTYKNKVLSKILEAYLKKHHNYNNRF